MAKKDDDEKFRLEIPLDASGIEGFKPDKAVKVVVRDGQGKLHSQMVQLDAGGQGAATFNFAEHPGSLHVVLGPEAASDEEILGLQTVARDLTSQHWQAGRELKLAPIRITAYWWWWWWWWCRTFTIRGRVVCADGNPVPGATVCAYDVDWWWWWLSEDQVGCATTDATGSFEIAFRWCCGWWPWWWWAKRIWRLEPILVERILPVLERESKFRNIPIPSPRPDLAVFNEFLGQQALAGPQAQAQINPSSLDGLRSRLLPRLPASAELERLRVWPWWPWWPWLDCEPDIIFKVTQSCTGQDRVIVNETVSNTRWDIPTTLDVTLVASEQACCIPQCTNPQDCPEGDCIVITDACGVLVANIGGNPGAPAAPAGFVSPGAVAKLGDRPFAEAVNISGVFGNLAAADYYEFEWSTDGITWNPMPPAAAGGFSRSYWGPTLGLADPPTWHGVPFSFTTVSGRNVIESRQHFQANNDPLSWGITRFWDASTFDLLMQWLTKNNFADGTYQLRVRSWTRTGYAGNLTNSRILPLCDTENDNGLVLTVDNRFVSAGPTDANGHPCGTGTVHTCTAEPDTGFIAVRLNGVTRQACDIVDVSKGGGSLEIDFMAHDPDGHLAYYTLDATYGVNLDINLLAAAGATIGPGPAFGAVPPAVQVGPTYADARSANPPPNGGAAAPTWAGGTFTLTIPDLHQAFPESCCYQLQLRAYKRTIVNCDGDVTGSQGHNNLSEYSFTVLI